MSTSGTYNYRPKVDNPREIFYQMTSDGFLPPFFFGGSQVPNTLGISGTGIKSKFRSAFDLKDAKSLNGRGIHTAYEHSERIHLPKHFRR